MRRSFAVLFSLSLLTLFTAQTFAQQRLGLLPDRFTLRGKGQTYEAEAFCLDRHLIQRTTPVSYEKILAGQTAARVRVGGAPPISLQEAINQGIVSVTGRGVPNSERFDSHLSLTFVSNDPRPISIELVEPVAFGLKKSSWINPDALTPLRQPRTAYASKLRQDMIWRADTHPRRLQVLGYYQGDPHEVSLPELRAATRAFQRAQGIPETGTFDPTTRLALDRAEEKLRADFARLGVSERPRTDTSVQDVTDVIRRYERYLGRKEEEETGLLGEALRARMAADEAVLRQVSDAATLGRAPGADLAAPGVLPDVLTFERYRDGGNVIVRGSDGPELWSYFGGKVVGRFKGRRAIQEFDDFSLKGAVVNSSPGTYMLQTGVYRPDAKIRVAFGPGPLLEVTPVELSQFMDGRASIPAFDERVATLTGGGGQTRPRVLISRSALNQGRGGDVGGGPSPLDGSGFEQIDPLRLALACERRYGDRVDIVIANDFNLGLVNLRQLPTINRGSQIRVYADRTHFKDYGTVATLRADLRDAGIEVVQAREAAAGQPGVIIITAQKNAQSRAYLEQLASERRFENSVLALASCGSGCDEIAFNSTLIRKSGARAVIFYDQNIHPEAVKLTLLKFCELMSQRGVPDGNFQQLLRQSVDELLKDPRTPMPGEVRKLRDAYVQVSGLRAGSSDDADE
jgi:hypothetical protein